MTPPPAAGSRMALKMATSAVDAASQEKMLRAARKLVPPLLSSFHKGQMGRVGVLGGSEDYTGAPYFSAIASAKLGADMSHVICHKSAGNVIKTYSPNLMVHPILESCESKGLSESQKRDSRYLTSLANEVLGIVKPFLPRLHVLVVGPGLGRDNMMLKTAKYTIITARDQSIPIVIDADALQLVGDMVPSLQGWRECVITPNVVEFGRLTKALNVNVDDVSPGEGCKRLAAALGGVTVVRKGENDWISNGEDVACCALPGGKKRSGGQGDTLTGLMGTWLAWRKAWADGLWKGSGKGMSESETMMTAVWAASALTRECSHRAFEKHGRSMQASDLTDEIHGAFLALFEDGDETGD